MSREGRRVGAGGENARLRASSQPCSGCLSELPVPTQAKYCFALFVKLQYCKQANDDDENAPACNPFSRGVKDICPMQWVSATPAPLQPGHWRSQPLQRARRHYNTALQRGWGEGMAATCQRAKHATPPLNPLPPAGGSGHLEQRAFNCGQPRVRARGRAMRLVWHSRDRGQPRARVCVRRGWRGAAALSPV